VEAEPSFAADLYRDTAEFYDRFRPAYPQVMTADLLGRARPSRQGRLLDLSAGAAGFELITIGNAFHRLRRDRVARHAFGWLRPGGHLALCWSTPPWAGDAGWQKALSEILDRWRNRLNVRDRIPPGWDSDRQVKPDLAVLAEAGFEPRGSREFHVEHRWTVAELAGFVYSTSFLAAPVFGELAPEFEADLAEHLHGGALVEQVGFAYDLARKPAG
jgi:hypothetical protein